MPFVQTQWTCPCCGSDLLVFAEKIPGVEVKPLSRARKRKRRTRAEMRELREQREAERLGRSLRDGGEKAQGG
jgi:hypothetical protein